MPGITDLLGASPVGAVSSGLQFLGGLGQTLFSGVKKANRNLENFAGTYKPNESISDFYNKSLEKYNANPYNSLAYQNATNKVQGNLATGISATQDRRGGLSSIGSLVNNANQADASAAARAEQQSGADLSRLGQAAGMKTREDKVPFDLQYNLLAAKAGAAAKTKAQGLQNMFGGLSSGAGLLKGSNGIGNTNNVGSVSQSSAYNPLTGTYTPKDEIMPF